jgi:hypothetical protein
MKRKKTKKTVHPNLGIDWSTGQLKTRGGDWVDVGTRTRQIVFRVYQKHALDVYEAKGHLNKYEVSAGLSFRNDWEKGIGTGVKSSEIRQLSGRGMPQAEGLSIARENVRHSLLKCTNDERAVAINVLGFGNFANNTELSPGVIAGRKGLNLLRSGLQHIAFFYKI